MARKDTAPAVEPETAAPTEDTAPAVEPETAAPTEDTAPAVEPETAASLVKIRMETTSAGPDVSQNWNEGQIRTVDAVEAGRLVAAGLATLKG